ncbi:MAG: DNA polymerase III subunit delta' [Ornithinimicrobium sp.]|uniref:DNA polymerase III subunit delta' n=1 Tax=Ornithinimicrobium sp. TaxID=1977084 RepID=UPI003D9BC768
MSVFDELIGQERVVATLRRAASDPAAMTHSWLFTGPPGSGRSVAARAFAAALQCEQSQSPGCGQCPACHTVLIGSHPDVTVVATNETFLRVDRARELALAAATRPAAGRWRILIVEDADRLNEQAADALLKTLEEPPPRTVWLLSAPTLDDLIVTVRSRCRHVRLGTPPVQAVAELLIRRDGIEASMAHYAARAAQSHVGIAKRLATDEAARSRRRRVTGIPLSLTSLGAALAAAAEIVEEASDGASAASGEDAAQARAEVLRQLGADPAARTQPPAVRAHLRQLDEEHKRVARRRQHDTIDAALTDLASVYRDALVLGSGADVEAVNAGELEQVRQLARALGPEELLLALESITLARGRLVANGAPLLVIEAMMIGLTLPRARSGARG